MAYQHAQVSDEDDVESMIADMHNQTGESSTAPLNSAAGARINTADASTIVRPGPSSTSAVQGREPQRDGRNERNEPRDEADDNRTSRRLERPPNARRKAFGSGGFYLTSTGVFYRLDTMQSMGTLEAMKRRLAVAKAKLPTGHIHSTLQGDRDPDEVRPVLQGPQFPRRAPGRELHPVHPSPTVRPLLAASQTQEEVDDVSERQEATEHVRPTRSPRTDPESTLLNVEVQAPAVQPHSFHHPRSDQEQQLDPLMQQSRVATDQKREHALRLPSAVTRAGIEYSGAPSAIFISSVLDAAPREAESSRARAADDGMAGGSGFEGPEEDCVADEKHVDGGHIGSSGRDGNGEENTVEQETSGKDDDEEMNGEGRSEDIGPTMLRVARELITLRGDGDNTFNYDPTGLEWEIWNREKMVYEERVLSGQLDDPLPPDPLPPGPDINPSTTRLRSSSSYERMRQARLEWNQSERERLAERGRSQPHPFTPSSTLGGGALDTGSLSLPDFAPSGSQQQYLPNPSRLLTMAYGDINVAEPDVLAPSSTRNNPRRSQNNDHVTGGSQATSSAPEVSEPPNPDIRQANSPAAAHPYWSGIAASVRPRVRDMTGPLPSHTSSFPHFAVQARDQAIPLQDHVNPNITARAFAIDSGTTSSHGALANRFLGSDIAHSADHPNVPRAYAVLRQYEETVPHHDQEAWNSIVSIHLSRERALTAAMDRFQ